MMSAEKINQDEDEICGKRHHRYRDIAERYEENLRTRYAGRATDGQSVGIKHLRVIMKQGYASAQKRKNETVEKNQFVGNFINFFIVKRDGKK